MPGHLKYSPTLQSPEQPSYASASWSMPWPPQTPPPGPSEKAWALIGFAIVVTILAGLAILISIVVPWAHKFSRPRPAWHHAGEVARPDQLTGTGRIYLMQLGPHSDPYTTVELSDWLRRKYSLDTEVLASVPLDPAAFDSSRHRYVAELLNAQIKREHPDLAADPRDVLIGFTDAAMYSATERSSSSFSQRDHHRIAIISSSEMTDLPGERVAPSHANPNQAIASRFNDRIRRILLKDVAVLFWHLRLNNDPGSILYYTLNPDIPNDDIYESDLDPLRSGWGEYIADPCVVLTYSAGLGVKVSVEASSHGLSTLVRPCEDPENAQELQSSLDTPESPPNTDEERIELRLVEGTLSEKHTDFFLPGPVPIRFERVTNNQWQMPAAFGMSGSHNYDRYLVSHDDMRHITVANAGSGDDELVRSPPWLPFLALNTWRDTDESGSSLVLRWRGGVGEHFDLTRYNGEVDSYLPCSDAGVCYLNGYHNSSGDSLTMQRDGFRRLTRIAAPQDNWLNFTYDPRSESRIRISEIADSRGRRVVYGYSPRGQLETVTYPSGEVLRYAYDKTHSLITVSERATPTAPSMVLITNVYENGKLVRETLADGSFYAYTYHDGEDSVGESVTVRIPDGTLYDVVFGSEGSSISQQSANPLSTN